MHPNPIGLCFWLVSYVPLCVLILLGSVFYFTGQPLPSITDYDQLDEFLTNPLLWCYFAAIILWLVEVVVFVCKGLQMQQQHSINLLSDFSYTEGAGLGWVRWMIGIMVIVSIVSLLAILFEGRLFKIIALLTVSMESIFTTIFVLRQRDLYQYTAKKESESGGFFKTVIHIGCYNGERASMEDFSIQKHELLKQNLLQLLEIDEIFKDSELSSEKMREMLGTNRTYLWQVINRDLGTNFYNLVNSYRLKKAEELMTNPSNENISLKNVAEICGFKSLSAFSNLFHKTYGVRAKDWRKNINSQQVENSIDDYR